MKILYVISELFFSEPMGVMQLSSISRKNGHETRLVSLKDHSLAEMLEKASPDLVCYSVMSSDEYLFIEADKEIVSWINKNKKFVPRIMGGPHPTYFPEILSKMDLDAICIGDGDNAMATILERMESGSNFSGIPNVLARGDDVKDVEKELVHDMSALPFLDRELLYRDSPDLLQQGIRSFQTQRGCPFQCSYCFNHAFNQMFKQEMKGPGRGLMRRRSVDHLFEEIRYVIENFPVAKVLRFSDDVFLIRKDEWLEEFCARYPKEIGIPFYCLVRPDSLTEEVAKMLSDAGCTSLGMSIESGDELIRRKLIKRPVSDEVMKQAFHFTHKYKLPAIASSIMGIPGTTLEDDFNSFLYSKKLKPAAPTFAIFTPFSETELTRIAVEKGLLDNDNSLTATYRSKSQLNCYTEKEKEMQQRLCYLAPLFCYLPDFMIPILKMLMRFNLSTKSGAYFTRMCGFVEATFNTYVIGRKIFPQSIPTNPIYFIKIGWRSVKYFFMSVRSQNKDQKPLADSIPKAVSEALSTGN